MEIEDLREVKDVEDVEEIPQVYRRSNWDMPPPAFWEKRLQAIENKRSRSKKERQEILRGSKPLKHCGLKRERRNGAARFVRDGACSSARIEEGRGDTRGGGGKAGGIGDTVSRTLS